MPCTYIESESEVKARNEKHWEALVVAKDRVLTALTHDNDILREQIIRVLDGGSLTDDEVLGIRNAQTAHRHEDIRRLRQVFATAQDWERLQKVLNADPTRPLEPQLGFDPDSF